jgi:hypothetical protein
MLRTVGDNPIQEYLGIVNDLHGVYLDAYTGFLTLVNEYDRAVDAMCKVGRPVIPLEAFSSTLFHYRKETNGDGVRIKHIPISVTIHECTQGQYRARNAEQGRNHIVSGQMFVAMVYNYWEDKYRKKIADAHNLPSKGYIKMDLFNDLRLLRNAITHSRGRATKDVECKCKILNWFAENAEIMIDPSKAEQLVKTVRDVLNNFKPPVVDLNVHWNSEHKKLTEKIVECSRGLEKLIKDRTPK